MIRITVDSGVEKGMMVWWGECRAGPAA